MNFIVFSSSRGTTFQGIIDAMNDGSLEATCLGLITDKLSRGCVEKAEVANIPVVVIEKKENETRAEYDKRLNEGIQELTEGNSDDTIIAAVGWMWILSADFVHQWKNKIVNVHPALLPKFPGAHAIKDALDAKETASGMTIHIIDEGVDTGKILVQKNCSIEADETEDSLKEKIQALEKEWYPKVLQMIHTKEISL